MISGVGILDTAADLFRFTRSSGMSIPVTGYASSLDNTLGIITGPHAPASAASERNALRVPAVARAVQLYATAAAKLTLEDPAGNTPAWLAAGSGTITPAGRVASLVLSLIWHGRAVLWVTRDGSGEITSAIQLPGQMFTTDILGRVCLNGQPVPNPEAFIYIPGLLPEGFVTFGEDAITHYLALRDSILSRSRNPIPVVELKVKDQFEVTEDELLAAQTNWSAARSAENGAVAVTPYGVDVIVHGTAADTAMLAEARNAVRLDVANFLNINASLLDGNNGTSDNYSNTLQNKDEFVDLSLDTFLLPIESRLSLDDVSAVPLRFDRSPLESLAPPAVGNTGAATERITA